MYLSVLIAEPLQKANIEEQAEECTLNLVKLLNKKDLELEKIVSLTIFLNARSTTEYFVKMQSVEAVFERYGLAEVPFNYLAQPPAKGFELTIEAHILISDNSNTLKRKELNGVRYVAVEDKRGSKIVFASGITTECQIDTDILNCSEAAFLKMEAILSEEDMSFNDIVRQWNYIEHIVKVFESNDHLEKQHYQLFNDVRSKYYNKVKFENGYPAATGIGTYAGGVIVSFYAVNKSNSVVSAVENPLQVAAYDYSENVLIGAAAYEYCDTSSPKFARAKYTEVPQGKLIYISGTASIRKEETIAIGNAAEQTKCTAENIAYLISNENLSNSNIKNGYDHKVIYYRVYIKNEEDVQTVVDTCKKLIPDVPCVFVLSDVCRDDLLLEIEAIAG